MLKKHSSERGSALIYIFVGVALFGILMFVFSRGENQGSSSSNNQQAKVMAVQIMDRANAIAQGVDMLLAKGCSINQLNFHSDHFTQAGTTNPNAPADGHCDVYSPNGAKLTWEGCPDKTLCPDQYLYAPAVPRSLVIDSLGDVPEDLVYLVLVRKDVCLAINAMLGLPTSDLPAVSVDGSPYIGTFSRDNGLPRIASGGNYTPFIGKTSGCLYMANYMSAWGGEYFVYYRVLVAL